MLTFPSLLERVGLNQSRFRMPGVAPDARGAVMGQRGLVLLGSLDGVVRFLRVWSRDAPLDDLTDLSIRRVTTPLGANEMTVAFDASSSYLLDRVAAIARLLGGFTFTGTSRHFVKYRDTAAPLGYDVAELLADPADLALYHDSFEQAYRFEREIALRDLVLRLAPEPIGAAAGRPETDELPAEVLVRARAGLGGPLQGYFHRSGVAASVAVVERPARSAFAAGTERCYLFRATAVPRRILDLLRVTPGVTAYVPVVAGGGAAVELGYRHPIQLEACAGLFDGGGLTLFSAAEPAEVFEEVPRFTPIDALTTLAVGAGPERPRLLEDGAPIEVPVRLVAASGPWSRVVATVIPLAEVGWFRKLVYALPPSVLGGARVYLGQDRIVLTCATGIDSIPLGTYYSAYGETDDLHVQLGFAVQPSVAPDVLRRALGGGRDVLYFFTANEGDGGDRPFGVPRSAFVPLSHRTLSALAARPMAAGPRPPGDTPTGDVVHAPVGAFPLWGAPGKTPPDVGEER